MSQKSTCAADAHIGNRMRLRRMLVGITQESMGDQLGLTFQQVQKYEKGVNRIGAGRLFRISQILNVPISYFFAGLEDDISEDTVAKLPDFTQVDLLKIANAFSLVPPHQRRLLVELFESFVPEEEPVRSAA